MTKKVIEKENLVRKCACCERTGKIGLFEPLPAYYKEMRSKYHTVEGKSEFLNEEEYTCKYCFTSDRGRMICAFLRMAKLPYAKKGTRMLHIAPEKGVEDWIIRNCPNVLYESTDLYDKNVSFQSDIQNMLYIEDGTYDYFICSHVLEHVQDDNKAIQELARILKSDGIGVLLVPVCLDIEEIDEEWGLTEAENWRRFGQDDHCRMYSKNGLIERLEKNGFYVHMFDKSIFGEKIFQENAFTDTSTLYVLSKTEKSTDRLLEKIKKKQCYENYQYRQKLLFSSCVLINNVIYTVTNLGNIPIRIDLQNDRMTCIDGWDKDYIINSENMIVDGRDIYLLDINGNYLLRYSIDSNQYNKIEIACHINNWGNYAAFARYKRNIYIFPKRIPKIVKINLDKDMEISHICYCLKNKDGQEVEFECGIQEKNLFWLFQKKGNLVMAYDMEANIWKSYELPKEVECCIHVVLRKGIFYILSVEGKVYSWNIQESSMRMVADCSNRSQDIESFGSIAVTDELIYLLPALSDSIYKINIGTGEVVLFDDYPADFQYVEPEGWSKYSGYCEDENYYYYAMRSSAYILCINKKSAAVRWIRPQISIEDYFNAQMKYSGMVLEESLWNVKNLLTIKNNLEQPNEKHNLEKKQIWMRMKEN